MLGGRHVFAGQMNAAVGTVFIASASGFFPGWDNAPHVGLSRQTVAVGEDSTPAGGVWRT